jgi:hypothetical protein
MDDTQTKFRKACSEAEGELWNLVARLEKDCALTGTQAAFVAVEILKSMPQVFTPHGLQGYINSAKESSTEW